MVEDRCPVCGLPKELCVCGEIKREEQKITVRSERRKYRKEVTLIEGLNPGELDIRSLLKDMKSKLACGGTYKEKEKTIILQGNHVKKVKPMLIKWGIPPEKIELLG
ncbi:MAG: stress response translation initiation inhibitor YciH [Thermoproteota archaeon]|jgi:translation initiation factor 1|uniref:Protein translation factor SUI1 homolog n=1 Tax=Candidatus Methanodesulfokora washburnensis TaxID=2478471 RepID=A0A429GI77_9CREN|nr:stress response translation initiation inhibitor YciH [Candidatus Methanodesulfokores washburnensis]RSN73580.1 stress response translation initiation inhibitor YciH [Candidatus Methanodesulfokores washburnensis]RZN58214.1 MAG: stress response translation initiation inhibitor YciH [Candidatus Methanodesulfokores washburnensis]TDA39879.1 MAG: stress response translation initiation inhibitor YciH [Candidatus Korarchaeota archaeon]